MDSSNETKNDPLKGKRWYKILLECEHSVYTPILLKKQYPKDYHYILCPNCKNSKKNDLYARSIPTVWKRVQSVVRITEDELQQLSNVPGWSDFILSRDILRIQPTVPANRCRPFPYTKGG